MFHSIIDKYVSKVELQNAISLISSNILKYAINIYVSVVIVKYLGVNLFGIFSYVNSITGIISVISGLGLQVVVVKEIILKQKPVGDILGSSLFLSFLSGFCAAAIQIIILIILNPTETAIINLGIINGLIFLFDTLKIYTYYYEAEVKSKVVAKINNITLIITTILKLLAIYFDTGLYTIAIIYLLDYVINGLLIFILFSKNEMKFRELRIKKDVCFFLLKKSLPLILSGLFIGLYMKIDQVIIKNILGNVESGIFALVVRLTEVWFFIPVIIQSTLFPNILKKHSIKNDQFYFELFKLYKILIIFSLIVITFMSITSSIIINNLFGSAFLEAKLPLLISIWSLLFVSMGVARNSFILSNNLNHLYLYSTIIGTFVNITLNLFFISKIGILGASIATFISQLITSHLTSYIFKDLRSQFYLVNRVLLNVITFNKYYKMENIQYVIKNG
jgi:O-antigen/teichoic acid export membrane protein